jgi:hypothetical protein
LAPERERWAAWLLPLLVAAGPLASDEIDPLTRIDGLEARLEGLNRRVQALETLLRESGPLASAAPTVKGEPTWELDDYSRTSPFQVLQRSLDRQSGRLDLLLDVVAPIPDLADWNSAARGEAVPLMLIADTADGAAAAPVPLQLERATRLEPGARLHLSARLEPGIAERVRRIQIFHAPDRESAERP